MNNTEIFGNPLLKHISTNPKIVNWQMAVYLKNATYIDWETFEFSNTDIKIGEGLDGNIEFISPGNPIPDKNTIIDCTGKYVTKSFAIGHHHVYSALARGMPAPKKTPENFREILKYIWWNLDKNLDLEMIETSALVTAIDCAKNGATFTVDHHASPNAIKGSLETIAKAFEKVGVSHLLCYEVTDRDGFDKTNQGLEEMEDYLQNHQGLVGLHASFTVGEETLKKAVELANNYKSGIHIHVAEDKYDQEYCIKQYGKRVVERLYDAGALNSSKTILGHCLHLNESERQILSLSPAWIVQNIESNLNNKVGFFNSVNLSDKIMLGTDGMHSDMIRSAKAVYFVGQNFDNFEFDVPYKRLRNVHHYLNENNFRGDGENNLIVLDYPSPTDFNETNFLGHFYFGLESKYISHVISNGKLIAKDRKIQTVDEKEILRQSKTLAKKLWAKMQN